MAENPFYPLPPGLVLPSSYSLRHYRSTSTSSPARQRPTDELLQTLTPAAAIEAFRNPTGTLKRCLDGATLAEQSYAMAAALASKKIQDWLLELSSWPWPSGRSSAGFDPSASRGRRSVVFDDYPDESSPIGGKLAGGKAWLGCLQAHEVARYEQRVAEIQQELDELDMERIKTHVMHNHILPLSRPGTPMSADLSRSTNSGLLSYNKMDDVTALITATVVQSLPNLSRLVRLLNTWNVRLLILRRVPSTLAYLDDAEVALRSGWNAVELGKRRSIALAPPDSPAAGAVPALVRKDFEIMKLVMEQKISTAGRAIDFMLDTLDGRQETVPDEWIDRMDKVEKEFGDWVVVCERIVREAEWARMAKGPETLRTPDLSPSPIMHPSPRPAPTTQNSPRPNPIFQSSNKHSPIVQSSFKPVPARLELDNTSDTSDRPTSSESNLTTIMRREEITPTETQTPPLPRMRNWEATTVASELSPPSSPFMDREARSRSTSFSGMPAVAESEAPEEDTPPKTPLESATKVKGEKEPEVRRGHARNPSSPSTRSEDDQLQQQISEILESIPAKIHLSSQPTPVNHLNPPDLQLPHLKPKPSTSFDRSQPPRSHSSLSTSSRAGSRAGTPSFLLAPAYARNTRSRAQRTNQDIKLYHLSRSGGEAPIKLFIRCVGENGERVMVRVGGGWADLGEYLKEYAIHHGRRSKAGNDSKIEVKDLPALPNKLTSSPASRPASAMDSPITPLNVRKTRRSFGPDDAMRQHLPLAPQLPKTPLPLVATPDGTNGEHSLTPPSEASTRSRSSSRLSWAEEDSSLGMSGPRTKNVEMSDESRAWVASVKEKVRIASGERRQPPVGTSSPELFGEMGKVGGTKRLFRKG